jgi:hypothetical protein
VTSMGVTPTGESPGDDGKLRCFASSFPLFPWCCVPERVIVDLRFSTDMLFQKFLTYISLEKIRAAKFRRILDATHNPLDCSTAPQEAKA